MVLRARLVAWSREFATTSLAAPSPSLPREEIPVSPFGRLLLDHALPRSRLFPPALHQIKGDGHDPTAGKEVSHLRNGGAVPAVGSDAFARGRHRRACGGTLRRGQSGGRARRLRGGRS